VFPLPHPPADPDRWQQRVRALFANIGQNTQSQDQGQINSKQARVRRRSAVQEGGWSWLHKLAQARKPKLNCKRLLSKPKPSVHCDQRLKQVEQLLYVLNLCHSRITILSALYRSDA
jgi:hypothetical protein